MLPAYGAAGTDGFWTEGNPGSGTPASDLTQDYFNDLTENLFELLLRAGIIATKGRKEDLVDAILGVSTFNRRSVISGATTVLSTHRNVVLDCDTSGGAFTVTLPNANTLPDGFFVTIRNSNANIVTVSAAAGVIRLPGGNRNLTNVLLPSVGDQIGVMGNGTDWLAVVYNVEGPAFSAYRATNQTGIVSGVETKVSIDTVEFDTHGDFSTGTSLFTVSVPGIYAFSCAVKILNPVVDQKEMKAELFKNGANLRRGVHQAMSGIQTISSVISTIEVAAAGDTFELRGWHNTGVSQTFQGGSALTYFKAHRIG
ncbi:MAG: hypothetical protein ACE5FA_06995 [Dehalococcoidia bacterium]